MVSQVDNELERLNRVLDDLAAERDPRDRPFLTPAEAELAETAALLKAAGADHGHDLPDDAFVQRLGATLAASRTEEAIEPTPESKPESEYGPGFGPEHEQSHDDVSRRGLLGRIAAAAAALAAGAGAGTVLRGEVDSAAAADAYHAGYRHAISEPLSAPMVPHDRGRWSHTKLNAKAIPAGSAARFRVGAVEGFMVKPADGSALYAVSAACTHMGCMISWLDSTRTFLCPCHGAQYNADGSRLNGVPRHPLPRLTQWIDDHGDIFIWTVDEHPAITTPLKYSRP